MSAKPTVSVTVSRHFTAPAEQVFDAWLDPARARRFLFATPSGHMLRAEIDPEVGGAFRFTERRNGEAIDHVGQYEAIERPRHLVFSFGVPKYSEDVTRVILDVAPRDGGTELTLTHEGVWADFAERTQ